MSSTMEFMKGMDISHVPEMLDQGAVFRDKYGNEREVFELLKENGVNSIRLRIWNEPENVPESGGYCNLEHTVTMAKKVKEHGMSFFLDFHYSDYWADPSKQNKPKAWEGLGFEELKQAVYDYTRDVLLRLKQEGAMPELVQIGNEIRSGMIFPDGEVPHYDRLVELVNAGIRATRDVCGNTTKVVIHLDQGGRFFYLRDWFDAVIGAGLDDFDYIGVSYYAFWHGTPYEFKESLVNLVKRYNKPVIVAETAHAWRRTEKGFIDEQQEKVAGFLATPEAQRIVLDLVMNITASLEDNMGIGIYYWEPVVLPLEGASSWAQNMGVFDEMGCALPALESFLFDRSKIDKDKVVKIYEPDKIIQEKGSEIKLPKKLKTLFNDGSCPQLEVVWEDFNNNRTGSFIIKGLIPQINKVVQIELQLVNELKEDYNFIPNACFEDGLEGWYVVCDDDRTIVELHPEYAIPWPAPPINNLYIESPLNFKFDIYKEIEDLTPGTYKFQVDYRGTNTTGVNVKMFAQGDLTTCNERMIYPMDSDWTTYEISDIKIKKGTVKLGVSIVSPPVYGKMRYFSLTKQETTP